MSRFTPRPLYHYETCIRSWVGRRDLMDSVEREESLAHSIVTVVTELHVYCQSGILLAKYVLTV